MREQSVEAGRPVRRSMTWGAALLLLFTTGAAGQTTLPERGPAASQATSTLRGTVTDAGTGAAVADAVLRLAGSQVSAVSDAAGSFVLRGMPPGAHTLELRHPDYGEHALDLRVNRGGETFDVAVHLSGQGMSMEVLKATVEETPPARDILLTENELMVPPADPTRYAGTVVERYRLQQLIGGARDLGDLIVRAIPAVRELEPDPTLDGTRCLQFGSTGPISLTMAPAGCRHPQVYLDGVILSDPSMAYDITSLEGVEWIQAIPAGEAAGDVGGATYGVILVATTGSRGTLFPRGGRRTASTRSTFDWADDPQGHPFLRTFLASAAGTAIGLAAGREVGRQCIYVEEGTQELDSSCSQAGTAGVSLAAVVIPALTSAIGARYGGTTALSRGRFLPAVMGAGLAIIPGYIYSLVTVGDGVGASNAVGTTFLLVGTPLVTTLADRLFRTLR